MTAPKAGTREIHVCVCKVIYQMQSLYSCEHSWQKKFCNMLPSVWSSEMPRDILLQSPHLASEELVPLRSSGSTEDRGSKSLSLTSTGKTLLS